MRSCSSSLDDVLGAQSGQQQQQSEARKRSAERGEPSGRAERRGRHWEPPDDTGTVQRNHRTLRNTGGTGNGTGIRNGTATGSGSTRGAAKAGHKEKGRDLSRDDLIFLLSLLEGELQARDEVITVLKSDKVDVALLEAKYGFVIPQKVLQALQRDAVQGKADVFQEDIYEKPMEELDKLVEKQREMHRRMLEQLLLAEQAHKQALFKLEDEKRNHGEFMKKSDEFTNLLEQERERLKLLVDQEKSYQERKEQDNVQKVEALKEELSKLKSFAFMVVDEQQRLSEQLQQQTARAQEGRASASRAQEELSSAHERLQEEQQKVVRLEAELSDRSAQHQEEQEAMTAKLSGEESQNRQLRLRLSSLSRQLDELEDTNSSLRRTEEELQELRDKVSRGECGSSGLMSELEELRKRVLEMEGKDGELLRMEEHCRELHKKLEKEASQSQGLKVEVERLNHRIMDMEKLEDAFGKSKQERGSLKSNLEKEKMISKVLSSELELLKVRVKELEAAESQLGKTELLLKEDLAKLKTLTVVLVDERTAMAEKLKQMENKVQNSSGKLQAEQDRVTSVTEKLIEESKKALRSKAELEEKVRSILKEKDELKVRLMDEEEKNRQLESKISLMKKPMQMLEKEQLRNKLKEEHIKAPTAHRYDQEDNKVQDLTQEVERLRSKLKDMNVAEGGLLKAEEFESLEKRFSSEQDKARALMAELEKSRRELSRYQLAEKNECNQEELLYKRLKEEEAKSGHLSREVQALKEKVHQFLGTEESLSRVRSEHSALQRKLTQQEVRNKELAREMENLTRELERYRRFSRSLRPGMTGRRFSDLHLSTKEVQTEPLELDGSPHGEGGGANDNSTPYRKELQLRRCSSNGLDAVNNQNNLRRAQVPLGNKDSAHQTNGDVVLTHSAGQPLHIKVKPDHGHNTATLEISSPAVDHAPSFTSTAIIPTSGGPPKQRITIIQNPAAKSSPPTIKARGSVVAEEARSDWALSPFTVATYSRALSPDSSGCATLDRVGSPFTTGAPEPAEVVGGHAVLRLSPDRPGLQVQRSNSTGPNVITTEDNKIHIHLGSPFLQNLGGPGPGPGSGTGLGQTPGNLSTGTAQNKMSSSILIKPSAGPVQRPAQITIPLEAFRRPGPTRIPKPKGCGFQKVTNGTPSKSPPTSTKEPPAHNNNPHLVNRRL